MIHGGLPRPIHSEGKRECLSLREMERDILRDVQDGLLTQQKVALNARWDDYIANKPESEAVHAHELSLHV